MTNEQIAAVFDEMADLLEIEGENAFRVRAYRNGAKTLRDLTEPVSQIVADPNRKLTDLEGIGDTLAEKIQVLVTSNQLPALEKLRARVPNSLRQVMQVAGVGAKKAAMLWKELQVIDLAGLHAACLAERVRTLKGFGEKSEKAILQAIPLVEQASQRLRIDQAHALAQRLRTHLQSAPGLQRLEFAGSYRRGRETVGDLDLLVISLDPTAIMDRLEAFPERSETLLRGDTKMSIRLNQAFQVDLRVVPPESFGAALQYFTGSKEHNVRMRSIAKHHGLRLNEYGLFSLDENEARVGGATEEEIYAKLQLAWVPPELRENRLEFQGDAPCPLPNLITLDDLRGDLHMHTTDSDGEHSILEMARAAQAIGLQYIAITDHSKRVSIARGLDEDRLLQQWQIIDQINQELEGFRIFKGVECDILESGEMDLSDAVLRQADWVMASIHFGQKQSRQQITDRVLGAVRHPSVSSISHPTGRLIGKRDPYEIDLAAVIQAAAEFGKCLELNANPHRLDLNDLHCSMARQAGVPIVINTDAHDASSVGRAEFGILQARRAGLEAIHVLNTRTLPQLVAWISDRTPQAHS